MSDHIERTAADWLARRNGGLAPAEENALATWLRCDPRHAAAFARLEQTWITLNAPRLENAADAAWREIDRLRAARARRRRSRVLALAAACLAIGAGLSLYHRSGLVRLRAESVATARPVIRTLADGSKIALRTGADVEIAFTATQRRVRLIHGEALFTVAKDPARPFVVSAGVTEVRAVGTEFSVARDAADVRVLVTEGRIAVANSAIAAPPCFADAGERVTIAPASVPAITPAPPAEMSNALAWRGTRLEFSDMPLGEAVHVFNQTGGVQLVVADPAAARRRITGVFWADDAEGLVRLLERGFDLQAERDGHTVRLRSRR